jgi:modulator of FtsH protease
MHAYSAAEWESLFLAGAGASAALTGLLFVAISINLDRILQGVGLPGRAGEAMVLLVAVLVVSMLGLVPGQSPTMLGAELLATGLLAWLILATIHVRAVRGRVGPYPPPSRFASCWPSWRSCRCWPQGCHSWLVPAAGSTG